MRVREPPGGTGGEATSMCVPGSEKGDVSRTVKNGALKAMQNELPSREKSTGQTGRSKILKISVVAFGIILGALFPDFWKRFLWLVVVVAVLTAVWVTAIWIRAMRKAGRGGEVATARGRQCLSWTDRRTG